MSTMCSDDAAELWRQIRVGMNAESFLRTDLGGYVVDRMMLMRREALDRLEQVSPFETTDVQAAQNEARIPLMVLQAISDCIEEYKLAEEKLTSPDE